MANVQFLVEADARRTKVIDLSMVLDPQASTGAGARIAYQPVRIPTGAGWFGEHGVGLEVLRAYWSLQWDDGVRNNASNADFNNIGAERVVTEIPTASGLLSSVTHSFRLLRNSQANASYLQTAPALDTSAFSVFRVKHIINASLQATASNVSDDVSTVEEGLVWDFTDGAGHGMVVTNPELLMTGMTLVMNTTLPRYGIGAGMKGLVTCKLVCRAVVVDLDTYHKCFA